ncbi:1152_t:CDS:2, partial [Gigaspora rosea]
FTDDHREYAFESKVKGCYHDPFQHSRSQPDYHIEFLTLKNPFSDMEVKSGLTKINDRDLTNNLPLNENTLIDSSKWIQLNSTILIRPFLGGKANDKFFFYSYASVGNSDELFLETYDTTLNKWEKDINFTGKRSKDFENFDDWVIDKNSGNSLVPQVYKDYTRFLSTKYYPPQVILPNGQILYFPSEFSSFFSKSNENATINSILSYDIVADSWQPINTTGQAPSLRSGHTAVLTSDGRIIIYGGTSKNLAATPSIVVLNTSNYEWSTPTEVNPIGPLESHTSTIVDNYMVTSFGNYIYLAFYIQYIKEIINFSLSIILRYNCD